MTEPRHNGELPSGWIETQLENVIEILDKMRVPINSNERTERIAGKDNSELFPYYGATGRVGWIDDYIFDDELVLLGEDGAPFLDAGKDVAYMIRGKTWVNNHAHVLAAHQGYTTNGFLMHYLNAFDYHGFVTGTTRLKLNQGRLRQIPVKIPPLPEQHRIVEKIEELFSDLDAGVAALRQVRQQLQRYRQAVLKAAVEGTLTEAWRAQHSPAAEDAGVLLERILEERRRKWEAEQRAKYEAKGKTPPKDWQQRYQEPAAPDTADLPDLPDGWVLITLDNVLSDIQAGKSFKCEERPPKGGETGLVKVSSVSWGEFLEAESKTCKDPERVNPGYFIKKGDFLFSRANTIELVGACVIVGNVTKQLMLSDKILRLHLVQILPEWVLYCLRSQLGRTQIESLATGNQESMRNIGQNRIRQIAIPLPPIAEQNAIVSEVNRLLSVAEETERITAHELQRANRLRQSILKRAFEGKLVPQDPSDEPASVLLGRIREEKKRPKVASKTRKAQGQPEGTQLKLL